MTSGQHWTDETDAEADALFDTFAEAEIRRRQGLCAQQISAAFKLNDDDALADLERMNRALTRTMLKRVWPHTP